MCCVCWETIFGFEKKYLIDWRIRHRNVERKKKSGRANTNSFVELSNYNPSRGFMGFFVHPKHLQVAGGGLNRDTPSFFNIKTGRRPGGPGLGSVPRPQQEVRVGPLQGPNAPLVVLSGRLLTLSDRNRRWRGGIKYYLLEIRLINHLRIQRPPPPPNFKRPWGPEIFAQT